MFKRIVNARPYRESRLLFQALFLLLLLLLVIPYLNTRLAPYIKLFLPWGLTYLAVELLAGWRPWKKPAMGFLLLFCASYLVTIALHPEAGLGRNAKDLLYMLMVFGIFFCGERGAEERRKECRILSLVLLVATFLLSVICLCTFFLGVSYWYVSEGELCAFGVMSGRLWGLYNPNNGGTLAALSILLSLGFLSETSSRAGRWFSGVNILVQTMALSLGGSRTSLVSLLAVLAVVAFGWQRRRGQKTMLCLAAALAAAVLGYLANEALCLGLTALAKPEVVRAATADEISPMGELSAESVSSPTGELSIEEQFRYLEGREGGVLSGRPILWRAALRAVPTHFFFGVSREGLFDAVAPYVEDEAWLPDLGGGGVHNIYLTVLVSSGAVGALFYGLTLFAIIRRLWPLWLGKTERLSLGSAAAYVVLLFLIVELAEARTMYQMRFFLAAFWMYSGFAVAMTDNKEVSQ